ncbi:hypothetical protein QKW35_21055 [Pontibacterium granulatum]|uniref:hypothetical protein n=1 Tax=Pontibacterium granulatum TaxID=2036029 RepID=UPI00249B9A43|nr:hypothetical protein [Pontibacterium granulatum]MDI3326873.1 hypothetical protein [Pontibacterium granulatum]
MLKVQIDEDHLVVILEPEGPLSETDFQSAAKAIDPLIEQHGQLAGIVIHTKSFPGWDSFAALCSGQLIPDSKLSCSSARAGANPLLC